MSTHKSLKVTFWTRTRDLLKGVLLYGTVNWKRASDDLKPSRLSPRDRKAAMPALDPEVIKPRHNPQAALLKTSTLLQDQRNVRDITAGAIVSDPSAEFAVPPPPSRIPSHPPAVHHTLDSVAMESPPGEDVVVIRRRRRGRLGIPVKRAPRSAVHHPESGKPGLFARLFGSR